MWIREVFLCLVGLVSGFAVSAGVFAFAVTLGVVPRFAGKTNTAGYIFSYETAIFFGGVCGTVCSLFPLELSLGQTLGVSLIVLFGLGSGIYVGCLAVALVEILDAFPIMFRRLKIKEGLKWALVAMALGKAAGALWFFGRGR